MVRCVSAAAHMGAALQKKFMNLRRGEGFAPPVFPIPQRMGGVEPRPYGEQEVRRVGVLRIATPACAPVRNDRFFGNAVHIGSGVRAPRPTGAGHGVRCERDVEDAVPYGRFVGGRADGTMWASPPTKNL